MLGWEFEKEGGLVVVAFIYSLNSYGITITSVVDIELSKVPRYLVLRLRMRDRYEDINEIN